MHKDSLKEVYSPSTTQLLEEQLRYSDTIILNKTDLIGEEALNDVKENLNKLNPQAPIIITTYSQFNDEQINGKVIQHNEIQHKTYTSSWNSVDAVYIYSGNRPSVILSIYYAFAR